jgi:hypothetical protein
MAAYFISCCIHRYGDCAARWNYVSDPAKRMLYTAPLSAELLVKCRELASFLRLFPAYCDMLCDTMHCIEPRAEIIRAQAQ